MSIKDICHYFKIKGGESLTARFAEAATVGDGTITLTLPDFHGSIEITQYPREGYGIELSQTGSMTGSLGCYNVTDENFIAKLIECRRLAAALIAFEEA